MRPATLPRHLLCLLIFLMWLLPGIATHATAGILRLDDRQEQISLQSHFQMLEDKTSTLDIRDILKPEINQRFRPMSSNLSAGYSNSVFWLRLDLQRTPESIIRNWMLEITPVMLDDIRLYQQAQDGSIRMRRAGDRIPFSEQEIRFHYPVFPLQLDDTAVTTVYLRIQSTSSVFLRATLWARDRFAESSNYRSNMMGMYYGIMLAMIVYNALLMISYRDISMLHYLMLSLSTLAAGMSVNGHLAMYVAPDWPWLVDIVPALSSQTIVLSSSLFISSFMHLKTTMPRTYLLFRGIQLFELVMIGFVLAGYNPQIAAIAQSVGLAQILLYLPVCLLSGLRGYAPGYIVLAASAAWISGVSLVPLRNLGIIEPSWITDYSFQIGSAIEVILLALAQAYRISLIKKESSRVQRQMLRLSQQAESELEEKVQLRTAELDEAVLRLEVLDKQKNEFLGIAAHDLKNPLTSIIGMSKLLLNMGHQLSEPQKQQYCERISTSGERMMHIVTNLLDVNALESGQLNLSPETIDLGKLLNETAQQYEEMLKAKGLRAVIHAGRAVMIRGDVSACTRIIDNLVSNAIKFSPPGRHIWLHLSEQDGMGRLEIKDEGPGLSAEDQTHLFTKFSRLSPTPTAGEHSSGLGLSIVKKLSEAQQGRVHCVSTPGQGAAFIVELPLAMIDPATLFNPA
ncbi:sensor histidine kinase [Undibacterium oligocarboniphilum]|uniref:histidine kinase n=1 Tax=Undibacterium oligocarboniphilum TaxID=666702 RepID=A0A850QLX1_9BURK|nr:sensor histidine kinase [Undibacterium oligocarboniphilum]MBC3869341.1 sensor histidine kinase [Undibacterium oligocarboniphilum]NVO77720.1 sensor histidine kinase [Undibacterium oligocarboniphilum]